MIERVNQDIKDAMKARQKERLEVLRYLKSLLLENKTSKSPRDEMEVVLLHQKKLKEAISSFPDGSPQQLKATEELVFLMPYLPEQMDEDKVKNIIKEILKNMTNPNPGMIMKELSPQIKGKFDGKRANQLVQELLKG